ncbi:MAG: beta-exotoxin transport system permease protein [Thermoleophilales bacterium]|nr:beta-exotoxin transport system permease protein [Thermoleophilales bacterium]
MSVFAQRTTTTAVRPARAKAQVAPPSAHAALRALVRWGLHDNRRAPLVWGGPLGAMSALVVALYPSIRGSVSQLVDGYPTGVKAAFGITDLGTVEAYLHAEMFSLLLPVAVAYFAMRCVGAAITGAEERGHLDTLLATPVARRTLVAGAFATTAIAAAGVLLVTGLLTAAAAAVVGEPLALGRLGGALAGVWGLALFFAGCAALAAGLLHRMGPVLGISAGLLGARYLLDVLGRLADTLSSLRWLSAFRYYGAPLQNGLDVAGFAVLVVVGALLAVAGAACLERRDITG